MAIAQSTLFTLGGTFPVGSSALSALPDQLVVTADFNGDGKVDIVTANTHDRTLSVLLNDGTGNFIQAPGSPIVLQDGVVTIASGDLNGDQNPDLVVAGVVTTTVLLGDGTGRFNKGTGIVPSNYFIGAHMLVLADFNGDNKIDLLTYLGGSSFLLPGDGTGAFGPPQNSPVSGDPEIGGIAAGDFNGDGKIDLASVPVQGTTDPYRIYDGNGVGQFQLVFNMFASNYQMGSAAAVADFNSDGKQDILTFRSFGASELEAQTWSWTGNSTINTSFASTLTSIRSLPTQAITGDFNGDGKSDWVGVNPLLGTVSVYLGDGTGKFTEAPGNPYVVGGTPLSVASGDFNGDGKIDLAVNTGSAIVILLNGYTTIAAATPLISEIANAASYAAAPVPVDSFAVIFGSNLAVRPGDPNIAVTITNANGGGVLCSVIYAAPGQLNIFIPSGLVSGSATLKVATSAGQSAAYPITIGTISPGLFTVDTAGVVPAAQVDTVTPDSRQTLQTVYNCASGACVLAPVTVNPANATYLILYGTGIRGRANLSDVSVTIGGLAATVLYAGAQATDQGLDQINVLIPPALAGTGTVNVNLAIGTASANRVQLDLQ